MAGSWSVRRDVPVGDGGEVSPTGGKLVALPFGLQPGAMPCDGCGAPPAMEGMPCWVCGEEDV